MPEGILNKIFYSTGRVCAKMSGKKNTDPFGNGGNGALDMKEPLESELEPIQENSDNKPEQVQEDKAGGKDLKPKSKKPVLGKEKKKSKTDARKKLAGLKKKTNSSNSNQEIKEAAEEILNAEFEKEIEQIEQKLAEI